MYLNPFDNTSNTTVALGGGGFSAFSKNASANADTYPAPTGSFFAGSNAGPGGPGKLYLDGYNPLATGATSVGATVSASLSAVPFFVLACNNSTFTQQTTQTLWPSDDTVTYASLGFGLTPSQMTQYAIRVRQLMADLGRTHGQRVLIAL